jgi:cysteine desulfurase
VALAAGFAQALRDATARLARHGQRDPLTDLRDRLLERLLALPGVRLSGPDPRDPAGRLPHHLSLLVADRRGVPLAGRELVRDLWRQGLAVSSGSACRSAAGAAAGSPVLRAMGYGPGEAGSGLRISLGPWVDPELLDAVPEAFERALERLAQAPGSSPAVRSFRHGASR